MKEDNKEERNMISPPREIIPGTSIELDGREVTRKARLMGRQDKGKMMKDKRQDKTRQG